MNATHDEQTTVRVTPPGYPTGVLCAEDITSAVEIAGVIASRGGRRVMVIHQISAERRTR